MAKEHETTIFRSGNSNAVRLPKGFAVAGERVRVRRLAGGRTLIEPTRRRGWPKGFLESFGRVTRDFDAPARPLPDREEEARARRLFHGDDE
jgi:virulence-associated protein VagC